MNPTIIAGVIGGGAVLIPSGAAALIAWGAIHATIDALKARMTAAETELGKVDQILADVSYIRGVLDGEARAARTKTAREARPWAAGGGCGSPSSSPISARGWPASDDHPVPLG
jgi:hypothetical protein